MKQEEIKTTLGNQLKAMLKLNGISITNLNKEINAIENTDYSVSNLQAKLTRGTISHSEVLQIADIIGYRLEWIKKY